MSRVILHIARRDAWERAQADGEYRADTQDTQGFVHCSVGRQWTRPLRALFAGVPDLVLLQVDERLVEAPVRYEPGVPGEAGGELFPHVYGTIPALAVVAEAPVPVALTQGWTPMPAGLARITATSRGAEPAGIDTWRWQGWEVTTAPGAIDRETAWAWLTEEGYWALGRSREEHDALLDNSIGLALRTPDGTFAGMARIVTDRGTMAYLADVLVLPAHRGQGRGTFLVGAALEHPELGAVRNWLLGTRDAHGLYERFGFERMDERWMRRRAVVDAVGTGFGAEATG